MAPTEYYLNDKHSRLNSTLVSRIAPVQSVSDVRKELLSARELGCSVCIGGGRHAMGGQQFAENAVYLDTRGLDRFLSLDPDRGFCTVEAGIQWPDLMHSLNTAQPGSLQQWTFAQKQTGANALTLGGAMAANVHGRGLRMKPLISDIESFTLVDTNGELKECSRETNAELFRLVIGGYGLFGLVSAVTLRLVPRLKLQRIVEVIQIEQLMSAFEQRIADGFLYGDFQFMTDAKSEHFLKRGVFSCYQPVSLDTPLPEQQRHLTESDWQSLIYLAHVDKARAFQLYAEHYLSTSGQIYWSDSHQMAVYLDDYHLALDQKLGSATVATEVICEVFVPRAALADYMSDAGDDLRKHNVDLIYGTIRLVERDEESFLAWASKPYAGVIFNLHVEHSESGIASAVEAFRRLIDLAIDHGGSFYLTYYRVATKEQVEKCYPRFRSFLDKKVTYDPDDLFQSEWYRHYRKLFAE